VYSEWLDMEIEKVDTKEQEARLRIASETKKAVFSVSSDNNGNIEIPLEQHENTAYFLTIKKSDI
ncbi:MAG: hypothetical protein IKV98_05665, partial [Clostridia bacterium]|nr:hypothetical protein [Clostridia bacterium]